MVTPSENKIPVDRADEPVVADDPEAVQSFEILSELLGGDSESVDLDTLFDAVLVAGSEDMGLLDTHVGQPLSDESAAAQTRIISGGDIDDMLNGMADTNAPDMHDLGVGGNLDPFNPDT